MGHVCPPVVVGPQLLLHAIVWLAFSMATGPAWLLWNSGGCRPTMRSSQGVGAGRAFSGVLEGEFRLEGEFQDDAQPVAAFRKVA